MSATALETNAGHVLAPHTASSTAVALRTGESVGVRVTRRTLDIVLSLVVLIWIAPVMLILMIAIRIETPGPALFRQTRVGRDGKLFTLYKLRGMFIDARERWPELYDYSFGADEIQTLRFHPEHDPRVTRVGRFIRRTSIDEVLNFWNVLRGDMSVVGPRPEIPEMLQYYGVAKDVILSVKPGVTSLAKASGRDGLNFADTLRLEEEYVNRRSLRLDAKVVGATALTVVLQRGVLPG